MGNFVDDAEVVRDAWATLRAYQILPFASGSPLLRRDLAQELLRRYGNEVPLAVRMLMRFDLVRAPARDFAAISAARFLWFTAPEFRFALERVPVGSLTTVGFTAMTRRAPKGGPLILIGSVYNGMLHEVGAWCSAALPYWGRPDVNSATAANAIFLWLEYFNGRLPNPPKTRISMFKWLTADLGNPAVNFVLGHEYGHILCNLRNPMPDVTDSEFDADRLGCELAMRIARHPLNLLATRRKGAAGVEIVLQLLRAQEESGSQSIPSGYPSAQARLDHLHWQWRKRYGAGLIHFVNPISAIFDAVIDQQRKITASTRPLTPIGSIDSEDKKQ